MTSTLLLNATYEPLRVIDTKRAIVLVLLDKAEIVHEGDDVYHSASTTVPVPVVVRLKRYVQVPFRARIPLSNHAVLRRDNHECAYCETGRGTTVDHVTPRAKGGQHRWENVVAACRPCNARKADKTLDQLGWSLRFKPFVPTGTMWLFMGFKARDEWAPYLDPATV
jgi:5-methylcytosine-specific restriction endonuclease McrA